MQNSYTYLTITLGILFFLSLSSNGPIITLLYAPFTSNNTKDKVLPPLQASKINSYRYNSTYIVDFYFLALKQLFSSSLQTLVKYAILVAITNSITFPSVARRDISLQFFGNIQSSLFAFFSRMIFATFYYNSILPYLSDIKKSSQICCYRTSQTSLQTRIIRPLVPSTRSRFIENSVASASSSVIACIQSCSPPIVSNYLGCYRTSGSRKKFRRSSLTISAFSQVVLPSRFLIVAILLKLKVLSRLRYRKAYYMFIALLRNSVQCSFFYFIIAQQKSYLTTFIATLRFRSRLPYLLINLIQLRIVVYLCYNTIRFSNYYRFTYLDSFTFRQCYAIASQVTFQIQSCINSTSTIGNGNDCND